MNKLKNISLERNEVLNNIFGTSLFTNLKDVRAGLFIRDMEHSIHNCH